MASASEQARLKKGCFALEKIFRGKELWAALGGICKTTLAAAVN